MPKTFRLWTLNNATNHFEGGASWSFPAPAPTHTVTLRAAKRTSAVNLPEALLGTPTRNTQLMHEGTRVDEYWVPIAVKCIGDAAHARSTWVDTASPARRALFDGITSYYASQFANVTDWWQPLAYDGARRMGTRNHRGYYDVLQELTPPGEQVVLVGYSEGGLVARTLAMLDERVSKRPIIAGFITVHSPNAGSVFGALANATHSIAGLLSVLFCAARVDQDVMRAFHTTLLASAPPNVGTVLIDWLAQSAEAGLADFQARFDAMLQLVGQQVPAGADRERRIWNDRRVRALRDKSQVLFTMHRWLSGLRGDGEYCFPDFDVRRLDDDFSVLGSVYDHPLDRIQHAAIVGYDFGIGNLIMPGMLEAADNFLPNLELDEIAADVSEQAKLLMVEQDRASLGPVSDMFRAFMENGVAGSTAAQLKLYNGASLRTGAPDWRPALLPKAAHDWIVPAAYQLIHPRDADGCIGNFVFDDQTHATGVSKSKAPIMNLLGVMAKRLA